MVVVNELGNQEPVGSVAPFPEPYVIVSHHTALQKFIKSVPRVGREFYSRVVMVLVKTRMFVCLFACLSHPGVVGGPPRALVRTDESPPRGGENRGVGGFVRSSPCSLLCDPLWIVGLSGLR